jgi:flagellar biosynthesis protein FlhA
LNGPTTSSQKTADASIERLLGNDILEVELGKSLIALADPNQNGQLLPSVTAIRRQLANQLGVILPKIRIRDNLQLDPREYRVLVQGNPVDIGTIFPEHFLAIDRGQASAPVAGAVATETVDGRQAFWVNPVSKAATLKAGYQVADATSVLAGRLSDLAFRYAPELLTRDATRQLIEETRKSSPTIIDELIPHVLTIKQIQQVLKLLVAEGISIRAMSLILETICDAAMSGEKRTWKLAEAVRLRLAPQITAKFLGPEQTVPALVLHPSLQDLIRNSGRQSNDEVVCHIPETNPRLVSMLRKAVDEIKNKSLRPVLYVEQAIRPFVSRIARDADIGVFVLGSEEIVGSQIEIIGELAVDQPQTNATAA